VLERLAQARLTQGTTICVDSTTLEAKAAMKSSVRRGTGESYMAYLQRPAQAEGIEAKHAAALLRMDRKRKKRTSNEDWESPIGRQAEITKLKDGRTALAYKGGAFRAIVAGGCQRQRGERVQRHFAHQFDTGGLDRLYVRGLGNVHKKFLIQAAACNLAFLMRSLYGWGKPRAADDRAIDAIYTILAAIKTIADLFRHDPRTPLCVAPVSRRRRGRLFSGDRLL
jgi:hypothetical protein